MYNAQYTADVIKKLLIDKHVTGKIMCQKCNLGINTLSNIRRGDVKSIETFYIIADYLDCSVDYLLGRSEISGSSYLTEEEKQFLQAYNAHPEYHAAVKAMLGIDNTDDIKLAAQKKPVKPITD